MHSLGVSLIAFLILPFVTSLSGAQVPQSNVSSEPRNDSEGAYLYIYRAPAHISRSSPAVFYQASTAISEYLAKQHVVISRIEEVDPSASTLPGENRIVRASSVPDLLKKAQVAGAAYVLVVSVDRPFTSWIKLTVQCLDLSGAVLWQETASNATAMTGNGALRSALRQFTDRVAVRIGQPGLKVSTDAKRSDTAISTNAMSPTTSGSLEVDNKRPDVSESRASESAPFAQPTETGQQNEIARDQTVVVPEGTVVRFILTAPVDAKTARVGDQVKCRVLDDVRAGNFVVISRRASASAVITKVEPPRRRQQPGSITIKIETVSLVTDQVAKLRGLWTIKSGNRNVSLETQEQATDLIEQTGGIGIVFLPFFLLKHGEHVVLPAGLELGAALDDAVVIERIALIQAQPAPVAQRHGNPLVTVYHLSNPATDKPKFYCGKAEVARLQHGTMFQFSVPPGKYWFRSQSKKNALLLTLEQGGEYYLRVDSVMTWGNPSNPGFSQFVRVRPQEVAEIETTAASQLDPKYIKDVSKIDLALLEATP